MHAITYSYPRTPPHDAILAPFHLRTSQPGVLLSVLVKVLANRARYILFRRPQQGSVSCIALLLRAVYYTNTQS